jgi:hypothetical protein
MITNVEVEMAGDVMFQDTGLGLDFSEEAEEKNDSRELGLDSNKFQSIILLLNFSLLRSMAFGNI